MQAQSQIMDAGPELPPLPEADMEVERAILRYELDLLAEEVAELERRCRAVLGSAEARASEKGRSPER